MTEESDVVRTEAPVILGVFDNLKNNAIIVHQERCAKVRNRNVTCLKCAAACTSGCISLNEGQLVIDESKCVGCGTCATVCPTCALEARNPKDERLYAECKKAIKDETCVIACNLALQAAEGLIDSKDVVPVVCAGRVEESLIVRLAAAGAKEVRIVCGKCEMCAQKLGHETACMVANSAKELLAAWGKDVSVVLSREFPENMLLPGVTSEKCTSAYNTFFAQECSNQTISEKTKAEAAGAVSGEGAAVDAASEDGMDADASTGEGDANSGAAACEDAATCESAADATAATGEGLAFHLQHVMDDGTLPHFIPDRRERLLDALCALGEPVNKEISSRLWGCIVIDGTKCVSCRMCATFCPTGAITKFDEEDGTFGVRHFPADCVKCCSCQDICPADAILVLDKVQASFLVDGQTHRYVMKERPTTINNAHQILSHMRVQMEGSDIFER
jgi:ferredoxin